ncbi:MAG TPA: DedA family protein [Candidatus Sulfotelmatobacter sp.]|nr:DedA family protein [Candidatus Sulfotelmatobacter sp.]
MSQWILEFLKSALAQYGYWTVAATLLLENAGIPVPGETVLLLASFLCYSEHTLQLPWLILVATLAATIGDNIGFAVGYYGGRPMLSRYQSIFRIQKATLLKGERLFARYGATTVFFARFVFGMRIIAGPLAGVLRMPWRRFMIFNFLGAGLWVTVISCAGYLFGRHWQRLQENVKRFDTFFAIFVLVAVIAIWLRSRFQNKAAPPQ